MKKNEKLFDAIGQIDERYIAEALEPMYQESVGTSDENKAAMPKKGKLFFLSISNDSDQVLIEQPMTVLFVYSMK
mgnify:FL=1